ATNHGLGISRHVPRKTQTRRPVVFVARKTLLHVQRVLGDLNVGGRQSNAGQRIAETDRCERVRQLNVVAKTVVKGEVFVNLPGVLGKESDRPILDAADGITKALDEHAGKSETISLDR